MLPNAVPVVVAITPSAKLGVAVVTLNWHLKPDEVAWILDDSGAAALVSDERLRPQVEAVAGERAVPVVWFGPNDPLAGAPADPVAYRWPVAWPVLYTSGTSGRPKGVVHNATAAPELMAMTQDGLAAMWGYREDDVHLAAGPMYHAGPWGYANSTLYMGGTVVLMERWDASRFLELVEAEHATTTFPPPRT
jgi:acyl-CoA synthetase (AMP-forming)/AMP-acid ligase II